MSTTEVAVGIESSDPLIARLVAHCDAQDVQARHAAFLREHVDHFHGHASDEEQEHETFALFQKYEEMLERVIAEFLEEEEMTPGEFFKHCRRLRESCKHGDAMANLTIVLSALDFDAFCRTMEQEARETQQAMKAAEDMGF